MGGPLKKYRVTMPSGTVATMKLNEADAERLAGVLVEDAGGKSAAADEPAADEASNKARTTTAGRGRAQRKGAGSGGG